MKIVIKFFVFTLLLVFPFCGWSSGTLVRNGGDSLLTHLRSMADSLNRTAELVVKSPESFKCEGLTKPSAIEKCRTLLIQAAPQLIQVISSDKVKIVISENPLHVPATNSHEQSVSARTRLGPEGDIEFYRLTALTSSSRNLMFLLTHEYLHKVFLNGKYLGDDDSIPEFADGRQIIDALAKTFTQIAENKGLLAVEKGVRDVYYCTVIQDDKATVAKLSSPRRFINTDSRIPRFESSLGMKPLDSALEVNTADHGTLRFQFLITAANICSPGAVFFPDPTTLRILKGEQIVAEQTYSFNPLCRQLGPIRIKFEKTEFQCKYLGAENDKL